MPARVLVVDDSALVRKVLSEELGQDPDIEVVGVAHDPYVARDLIIKLQPDVLTLDVEMPRMDGITFLKKLMIHYPLPVIIVSSLTQKGSALALEAIRSGAVDVMAKPGASYAIGDLSRDLIAKIKEVWRSGINTDYLRARLKQDGSQIQSQIQKTVQLQTTKKIIAIGSSTGGTRALEDILTQFPVGAPGTVIVQHMPEKFTKMFADRLNEVCQVEVREAEDGDKILPGTVFIAPGNKHMQVRRSGAEYFLKIVEGPLVCHHRPSVDVLFRSLTKSAAPSTIAIMLTGMGDDGADAMVELKKQGAKTIAQDEESSVVFGMPAAAIERGAIDYVESLNKIPERLWSLC